MSKANTFVGMDVHQRSIDLTLAEGGHDGAITHFASIGGDLDSLDRAVAIARELTGFMLDLARRVAANPHGTAPEPRAPSQVIVLRRSGGRPRARRAVKVS